MLTRAPPGGPGSVEALRPFAERGVPIVGLEPSCVAVFRDELPNLFPDDPRPATWRRAVRTFAEFVDEHPEAVAAGERSTGRRSSRPTATSTPSWASRPTCA